ncbi:hypothetical protein O3G_MSEX008104 [Manduca sexta]|uniref:Uncharacterized protein n=1 Tax=Manduca sexta TaxID=7130 RepID=A0A921Z8Q2_MANSE|nr:hypothetical protein O3G_MSEX008104 [Manduca sexta]
MCKYSFTYIIMQKNTAMMTAACVLLCLTFNYTFPLHRQSKDWPRFDAYTNHSNVCHNVAHRAILERTKKMASNIESALKKIKDSTQDLGKNIYGHINSGKDSDNKNALSDENLRQYEQLVMMKKYPYLDLKELDLKYSPSSSKSVRHLNLELHTNLDNEPSLCEQMEEGLNVEIYNRGLSGFSIPTKPKSENTDFKQKLNTNVRNIENPESTGLTKLVSKHNRLQSLRNDISNFEDKLTSD